MDIFNDYSNWEDRYKELNNELVIPEYNKFLEKHGINFSILDDLPQKGGYQFSIKHKFHERCLNVFNKARKRFHFHQEKIVTFYFTTALDFHYDEWTIEEFLEDAGKAIDEIEILESKLKIFNYISAALALILVWTLPALIALYFFPENYSGIACIILGIVGFFIVAYAWDFLPKYLSESKEKSIHKEIQKIKLEISKVL